MMKKSIKTWLRVAGVGLMVGSGVLLSAGCVAYAPGPGGYYDYYYYPDWDVYFYPAGGIYYWNESGHWYHGRHVPPAYHFHEAPHEDLHLQTRQPWMEHPAPHPAPAHGGGPDHNHNP
jgi:hypothetical protein